MNPATGIAALLLPLWLPLVASPVIYLLRRWAAAAALLASSVMLVVGGWLVAYPPAPNVELLGRVVYLSDLAQVLLIGLAFWLVAAFFFAWRVSQGWSLFPFLLAVYSLIAAALYFDDLVLQVLLLKIAWLIVILIVQGGSAGNIRASTRLMVLSVLALPPFLIASALMAQVAYQPDPMEFTGLIVLSLSVGFALMLAIIPFHAWLPQAAEDGPPLVAAWLVAGMGGAYLVLLFDLLARYRWLSENPQVQDLLFAGGLALAIGGGILAVTERHLGRLWSYVVLADLGYILLGLSFDAPAGKLAALLTIGSRLVSVLLAGGTLATIRHHATTLDFEDLIGVGRHLPLSILGFAIGGLAMVGAPLTAGFPGHWAVLRLLATENSPWVWVLVASSVLGMIAFARAFAVMMSPEEGEEERRIEGEPRLVTSFVVLLGALSVLVGLAPHMMDPLLGHLLTSFRF